MLKVVAYRDRHKKMSVLEMELRRCGMRDLSVGTPPRGAGMGLGRNFWLLLEWLPGLGGRTTGWWSSATVATVTGSNMGIGFEIARQLAEHGLTVIVASIDPVQGRAATDGLREQGLSVDLWQLDVSDAASVGSFAQWVVDKYGGLDILAERRRKLGLPAEVPASAKLARPPVEEKKSFVPIKPTSKVKRMRGCLRTLKQTHKDDDAKVKKAFQTLLTYTRNVARSPDEEKFRKIRLNNPTFQERVGNLNGGIEFLEVCGFEKIDGGEFLFLPREKVDMAVLNSAGSELNSAISNPFFGVL